MVFYCAQIIINLQNYLENNKNLLIGNYDHSSLPTFKRIVLMSLLIFTSESENSQAALARVAITIFMEEI